MTTAKTAAAKRADAKAETADDVKDQEATDTTESSTAIAQPEDPNPPLTVEGKDGIERIVQVSPDGWEPAPIKPTDEEIKAAEEREKRDKERREARLATAEERAEAKADKADDEDKA